VSAAGAGLEFLPDRQAARAFQQEFTERCQRGAQLVQPQQFPFGKKPREKGPLATLAVRDLEG
jgi:hypothetical protein